MKTKGGILNGTENMGSKELQEKTVILQKWTGKKNGKHIDPKKKVASWIGRKKWEAKNSKKKRVIWHKWIGKKNGKQIDAKKETGILNGTEKMGSK